MGSARSSSNSSLQTPVTHVVETGRVELYHEHGLGVLVVALTVEAKRFSIAEFLENPRTSPIGKFASKLIDDIPTD